MTEPVRAKPDWDQLFTTAQTQQGLFTTQQAADAGFSPQLLASRAHRSRACAQRGIYRTTHYPPGTQRIRLRVGLWTSGPESCRTRQPSCLHELSDVLPSQIHRLLSRVTKRRFPLWYRRTSTAPRRRPAPDRTWVGAVPTTSARRTLNDCGDASDTGTAATGGPVPTLRPGHASRTRPR